MMDLPRNLPVPILIGLHIPGEYTEALARRLDAASALHVVEAYDGLALRPGLAVPAKGGLNLRIKREAGDLFAQLTGRSSSSLYAPSIDVLFGSAARACGVDVLGVVLTGMGDDGLLGSRAIVAAGGHVLTEAESSCVVYGMPRTIKEAGCSFREAPIDAMATAIVDALQLRGREGRES
jgi:two-component system chemotaxis response regulator CheB